MNAQMFRYPVRMNIQQFLNLDLDFTRILNVFYNSCNRIIIYALRDYINI